MLSPTLTITSESNAGDSISKYLFREMNSRYVIMMSQLKSFTKDRDRFLRVKCDQDQEIAAACRFIKNEVIEVADMVEELQEASIRQEKKLDAILSALRKSGTIERELAVEDIDCEELGQEDKNDETYL